nr:hypothetical protein [Tanacetum cinerariifolium]
MEAPLSPDRVLDFPMVEPEPYLAYDFFAVDPIPGLAEAPGNMNMWIEEDVPLGGKMGDPMEIAGGAEEVRLDFLFGDDTDGNDDEWLMDLVTPPRATVTFLSTYEVGGPSTTTPETLLPAGQPFPGMTHRTSMLPLVINDLCVRMGNLEYGHGALMKKMRTVIASQAVQVVSRLEEIETRVQQVEGRVDTHPSGCMTVSGQDVIVGLSQQGVRKLVPSSAHLCRILIKKSAAEQQDLMARADDDTKKKSRPFLSQFFTPIFLRHSL